MPQLLPLILASRWQSFWPEASKRILATAAIVPILLLATITAFSTGWLGQPSQKTLITSIRSDPAENKGEIIYWQHRPFSARYYSEGKALLLKDINDLRETLNNNKQDYLVISEADTADLPEDVRQRFIELKTLSQLDFMAGKNPLIISHILFLRKYRET